MLKWEMVSNISGSTSSPSSTCVGQASFGIAQGCGSFRPLVVFDLLGVRGLLGLGLMNQGCKASGLIEVCKSRCPGPTQQMGSWLHTLPFLPSFGVKALVEI